MSSSEPLAEVDGWEKAGQAFQGHPEPLFSALPRGQVAYLRQKLRATCQDTGWTHESGMPMARMHQGPSVPTTRGRVRSDLPPPQDTEHSDRMMAHM